MFYVVELYLMYVLVVILHGSNDLVQF